jgi:cytidylate kinase
MAATRRINIAIDGPASSGKGTVAREVARALGYAYVDTGAIYRAVAFAADAAGVPWSDEERVAALARALPLRFSWAEARLRVMLGDDDVTDAIRAEHVGRGASAVAVLPAVRAALLDLQRGLAAHGGVVMDGRDIGTVILPGAELKVFLDAAPAERARRRTLELRARGEPADEGTVLREIVARDAQDSGRATAPLRAADDAIHVDTTALSAAEAREAVLALARARIGVTTP